MTAIERLKRDHAILRAKLDVLQAALEMGPEAWFVIREMCFTLARQLRDHIKREEALIAATRPVLGAEVARRIVQEHQDEPVQLRSVNRLFVRQRAPTLEAIRPMLTTVIRTLRHHMEEEEAALFPLLERAAAEQADAAPPSPAQHVQDVMTVNRVLQRFPATRPVFERLFINIPLEGCTCLDEVAWRHGLESEELLRELEAAIAPEALASR
ncbi:MAG: hemerythrin domain-containing protein [Candidatus Omnitrophica bacterium]|nr:hemerythrin domain-containing protein [Candidatus Omnitrophota bacterium]